MMMPKVPPDMMVPRANLLSYPAAFMAGYITVPMASMVTMLEPEMAAKIPQLRMAATARPPGKGRAMAAMMSIKRLAVDPWVITLPHRMNRGIERINSLSSPTHMSSIMKSSWPLPQANCTKAQTLKSMTISGWRNSNSSATMAISKRG